jgi:hypothetical protein
MPAQVPVWLSGLPGLLYFLMSFTGLVVRRSMRGWRAREEARR